MNIFSNQSIFFNSILPFQAQDGIIENIINENVKNKKSFLGYSVSDFIVVENFVPNSFFIQDYTSRKLDTLKTYIENIGTLKKKAKFTKKKYIFDAKTIHW